MSSVDNDEGQRRAERERATEKVAADTKSRTSLEEDAKATASSAVELAKTALQPVVEFLRDCKEGAIEGQGSKIGEQVCSRVVDAVGGSAARQLGEGASDIVNGKTQEGIAKCARAAADIAEVLVSTKNKGTFFEDLAKRSASNELDRYLREQTGNTSRYR